MPGPCFGFESADLRTMEEVEDLSSSIQSDAFSRFGKPSSRSW